MASVTVLGQSYDLAPPASYALRWEIAALPHTSVIRARAAALVACAPQLERRLKVPPLARCGFSAGAWAGECFDALAKAGVKLDAIMRDGETALDVLTDGLVTEADVDAAEGFSEAPADPT